jgi:hypothetical protein
MGYLELDYKDLVAFDYASKGEEAGKGGKLLISLRHQEAKNKQIFC